MRFEGFTCLECRTKVKEANVMVERKQWRTNKIDGVSIICKPCTRTLDKRGGQDLWHNAWEARWIIERPFYIVSSLIDMLTGRAKQRLSREGAEQLMTLVTAAHPEFSTLPMSHDPVGD